MRSAQRPSELRWLYGVVLGVPLLMFALLLELAEGPACRLLVQPWSTCPTTPDITYESLFGAAAVCLLYSFYRAYRDFFRGDLERDVAKWCGHVPSKTAPHPHQGAVTKEPVVADAVHETLGDASLTATGLPAEKEWVDEISKELEAILPKYEPDQVSVAAR